MNSKPVFTTEPKLLSTKGQWLLTRVTEALDVVRENVSDGHVAGNMQGANKRALSEAITLLDEYCKHYAPKTPAPQQQVTRKLTLEETGVSPVNNSWLKEQAAIAAGV